MSQRELAGDRCTAGYVSHVESGARVPSQDLAHYFEDRLKLPPGALGPVTTGPVVARRRRANVNAIRCVETLARFRREGRFEDAERFVSTLPEHMTPDTDWLIARERVEILKNAGQYARAAELTETLLDIASKEDSNELIMLAETAASTIYGAIGDVERARRSGVRATVLAASLPNADPEDRANALIAALAAGGDEAESCAADLSDLVDTLEVGTARANALWALGSNAFRDKNVAEGIEFHQRALELYVPDFGLLNWIRFPRASATARLQAGTDEGVAELLEIAEARLKIRPNEEEAAILAWTQGSLLVYQEKTDAAIDLLSNLESTLADDISLFTRAAVLEELAKAYFAADRIADGERTALAAAEAYTEAGDLEGAQSAWALRRTAHE